MKPKYGDKAKLHYMDTDHFTVHIREGIYIDISKDLETKFETLNYKLNGLLCDRKKVIALMKDELGGEVTATGLEPRTT